MGQRILPNRARSIAGSAPHQSTRTSTAQRPSGATPVEARWKVGHGDAVRSMQVEPISARQSASITMRDGAPSLVAPAGSSLKAFDAKAQAAARELGSRVQLLHPKLPEGVFVDGFSRVALVSSKSLPNTLRDARSVNAQLGRPVQLEHGALRGASSGLTVEGDHVMFQPVRSGLTAHEVMSEVTPHAKALNHAVGVRHPDFPAGTFVHSNGAVFRLPSGTELPSAAVRDTRKLSHVLDAPVSVRFGNERRPFDVVFAPGEAATVELGSKPKWHELTPIATSAAKQLGGPIALNIAGRTQLAATELGLTYAVDLKVPVKRAVAETLELAQSVGQEVAVEHALLPHGVLVRPNGALAYKATPGEAFITARQAAVRAARLLETPLRFLHPQERHGTTATPDGRLVRR